MDFDFLRLMSHVTKEPGILDTFCWIVDYAPDKYGYCQFKVDGKLKMVHRFSYECNIGPIPPRLVIDHLCLVRNCINPKHLEAITQKENVRRSSMPNAITNRTNICKRGHSMSDAYIDHNGGRHCSMCSIAASHGKYLKKKYGKENLNYNGPQVPLMNFKIDLGIKNG